MFKWFMLFCYIVLITYIFLRGTKWLKFILPLFKHKGIQSVLGVLYVFLASTIFWGAFLPLGNAKTLFAKIGNVWLGFFVLLLFFLLIADIIFGTLKLVNRKKELPILKQRWAALCIGVAVLVPVVVLTIYGTYHANRIYTSEYEVTVNKEVEGVSELKIALVADMHLGYGMGCQAMEDMVKKINATKPDVVIFAGDIFNNDYDALDDPERLEEIFRGIQAEEGVYAVWGNHDIKETLVGGFSIASKTLAFRDERMEHFMENAGITVLMDEMTPLLDGKIQLVGRLDGQKAGDGTSDRKSIQELTQKLDHTKPVFVISHEPNNLQGNADCGVDVLLSGHTHDGQFFPLTLTQSFVWDNPCGLLKVGNMYSLVTAGVGYYGPALRIGTNAEVMSVTVKFAAP